MRSYGPIVSMTAVRRRLARLRSWRACTSIALRASSALSLRASLARTPWLKLSNVASVAPSSSSAIDMLTSSSTSVTPR